MHSALLQQSCSRSLPLLFKSDHHVGQSNSQESVFKYFLKNRSCLLFLCFIDTKRNRCVLAEEKHPAKSSIRKVLLAFAHKEVNKMIKSSSIFQRFLMHSAFLSLWSQENMDVEVISFRFISSLSQYVKWFEHVISAVPWTNHFKHFLTARENCSLLKFAVLTYLKEQHVFVWCFRKGLENHAGIHVKQDVFSVFQTLAQVFERVYRRYN